MNISKICKKKLILFFFIPSITLLGSIYQAIYAYDSFHWGLILFTGELINEGGTKIYKDVFVHYGPLTTFLEAFTLKIFKNNIIYIFIVISLFYSISIFLIQLIINKIINYKYAILSSFIIFFTHPFVISPWHNYTVFFFFTLYIFLKSYELNVLKNFSYFFLGLSILFSESFLYPCILIFLFDLYIYNYQKRFFENFKIYLVRLIYFISPILIFFIYIFYNKLFSHWYLHHSLPEMYLNKVLKMSFYDLFYNFFKNIFNYSFKRLFQEPQWFFYLILICVNTIYFLITAINFFKIKKKNNLLLFLISFSSLVLLYNTLHNFSIFKFATGTIIGLIVFMKILSNIKKIDNQIIFLTFIFLLTFLGFEFSKNNSNLLYVNSYQKSESANNDYFNYFKSQKWSNDIWGNLIFLDKNIYKISKACNIKYAANLTSDGFYSTILRKYLITDQKIPWFENIDKSYMNKFYNAFSNKFDENFYLRIQNRIKKNNIILTANRENFPIIEVQGNKIQLDNDMKYIDIPYSYEHKKKIIIFPKNCFF